MTGLWYKPYSLKDVDDDDISEEQYFAELRKRQARARFEHEISSDEDLDMATHEAEGDFPKHHSIAYLQQEYAISNMLMRSRSRVQWVEDIRTENRLVSFVRQQARKYLIPTALAYTCVLDGLSRLRARRVKKDWKVWLHKSSAKALQFKTAGRYRNDAALDIPEQDSSESPIISFQVGSQELVKPARPISGHLADRRAAKRRQPEDAHGNCAVTAAMSESALWFSRGRPIPRKIYKEQQAVGGDEQGEAIRRHVHGLGSDTMDSSHCSSTAPTADHAHRNWSISQPACLHMDTSAEQWETLSIRSDPGYQHHESPGDIPGGNRNAYVVDSFNSELAMTSLTRTPSDYSVISSQSHLSAVTSTDVGVVGDANTNENSRGSPRDWGPWNPKY